MKRRRSPVPGITLFPFMSVLACVIGTLTLLISGLALGEMGSSYLAEVEREEAIQEAIQEAITEATTAIERARREVSSLASELSNQEGTIEESGRVSAEFERVRAQQREGDRLLASLQVARQTLGELSRRKESLERDVATLERLAAGLRDELTAQQRSLERAFETVLLRPSGSGTGLRPRFVECSETGLRIDPDQSENLQQFVRAADIVGSHLLRQVFREAGRSKDRNLILLVRPDSVAVYMAASAEARQLGIQPGAVPVPTQKPLDFSLFRGS